MTTKKDHDIIIRKIYTENPIRKSHYVHTNEGHELYLLLQGDVSFSIDGHLYNLEPYDILIISNKEMHRTIINSNIPHERMYIYFDPNVVSQFNSEKYNLLQIFENRTLGYGNKIGRELVKKCGAPEYFEQIYNWSQSDRPEQNVMMLSILVQLIAKLSSVFSPDDTEEKIKNDVNYNGKIYLILNYISSNLHKKITLDELEENFYINKYYLCHLFKKVTGFTVMEYITHKKVSTAKELLKKGYTIKDVCINLGFDDYSNFYRVFKKITGYSPRDYVEKYT